MQETTLWKIVRVLNKKWTPVPEQEGEDHTAVTSEEKTELLEN